MRFLQFFNIYPQALQELYSRWPQLHFASHQQQVSIIQAFGFCSGYLFAPYMQSYGYEPILAIPNDPISQSQWARENSIALTDPTRWLHEIAAKQIEHYKPDIVWFSEPIGLDSKFLRSVSYRPKLICGWRAAPIPANTDWSEFDIIFSNLSALREMAPRLGAKSTQHFWPGFERRITEIVKEVPQSSDLVFCGQWTNGHVQRNELVRKLADGIEQKSLGFSCALHVSGDLPRIAPEVMRHNLGGRFGLEYYMALKSGAIALDARGTILTVPDPITGKEVDLFRGETGTNRMLEVTGVGSLLMAEHYENLRKYFEIDSEIVTYTSFEDLVEKVRYLRSNPQQLKEIATRGHARCMREHAMEVRAAQLHEIFTSNLSGTKNSVTNTTQFHQVNAQQLAAAVEALKAGDVETALQLLNCVTNSNAPQNAWYTKALCFARTQKYAEAYEALVQEVELYPHNAEAQQLKQDLQIFTSTTARP